MARKLQSDKWLFVATLALVCASVVMVYSASAVMALERYQQPYLFVTKQLMWAMFGIAVLFVVMHVDYRTYRNERLIWWFLGIVGFLLVAVLFSTPIKGSHRWFSIGPLRHSAVRAGETGRHHLRRWRARAAHAPHQRAALLLPAIAIVVGRPRRLDPHRARSRNSGVAARGRRAHGLRGRAELSLPCSAASCSRCPRSTCSCGRPTIGAGAFLRFSIRGPTRSATASRSSSR